MLFDEKRIPWLALRVGSGTREREYRSHRKCSRSDA
jgi:hypothetical protein